MSLVLSVTPIKTSAKSNKALLFVCGFESISDNIEWHLNEKKKGNIEHKN